MRVYDEAENPRGVPALRAADGADGRGLRPSGDAAGFLRRQRCFPEHRPGRNGGDGYDHRSERHTGNRIPLRKYHGGQSAGRKEDHGRQNHRQGASQTTSKQGGWSGGDATGKKLFDKRSGVKGEVKLFIPWDTSGDEDFKAIKAGFEKEYPGTTVKVINGEWGTRDIKLTQFIRNGDSPDYVPTGVFDFPRPCH